MYIRKTRRIKELERQLADLIQRTTIVRRQLTSDDIKRLREERRKSHE